VWKFDRKSSGEIWKIVAQCSGIVLDEAKVGGEIELFEWELARIWVESLQ
jgi:hypothetical protein